MGTMGPVSEEPGLSLWDAMSVLCPAPARRGVGGRRLGGPEVGAGSTTHHSVGNPLRSGERKGENMRQQASLPPQAAAGTTGGLTHPAIPGKRGSGTA